MSTRLLQSEFAPAAGQPSGLPVPPDAYTKFGTSIERIPRRAQSSEGCREEGLVLECVRNADSGSDCIGSTSGVVQGSRVGFEIRRLDFWGC